MNNLGESCVRLYYSHNIPDWDSPDELETLDDLDKSFERQYIWSFPAAGFQLLLLRKNLEEIEPLVFNVEIMQADPIHGFVFYGRMGGIKHVPENWTEFYGTLQLPIPILGYEAANIFERHRKETLDSLAAEIVKNLDSGTTTFEELRDHLPFLFSHPLIKDNLATRFRDNTMPRRGRGKPSKRPGAKTLELYRWASYYYSDQGESLENACASAIENHSELIPSTWVRSPEDNLIRTIARLDKIDSVSLHIYRTQSKTDNPE